MKRIIIFFTLILTFSAIPLAQAQFRPKPQPKKVPAQPGKIETPQRPSKKKNTDAKVEVRVQASTARLDFDISLQQDFSLNFQSPRHKDGLLKADALVLLLQLKNYGIKTWAFRGNRIEIALVEGFHEFDKPTAIDRQRSLYYPARAIFDAVIEPGKSLKIPIIIQGSEKKSTVLVPVPSPRSLGPEFRQLGLKSGKEPVKLKPGIWYTFDVRLYPAEKDVSDINHGMYLQVRLDTRGNILEKNGPFLYKHAASKGKVRVTTN